MISRQNYGSMIVTEEELNNLLKDYWNDIYNQFATECIEVVYDDVTSKPDYKSRLTLSEIYSAFKVWFRINVPGVRTPERSIVRWELTSRWLPIIYNICWLPIIYNICFENKYYPNNRSKNPLLYSIHSAT